MSVGQSCKTCRFWWSWEVIGQNGYGKGECRRYPPTVALLPKSVGGDTDRATPVTGQAYWCGEWKVGPRPAAGASGGAYHGNFTPQTGPASTTPPPSPRKK